MGIAHDRVEVLPGLFFVGQVPVEDELVLFDRRQTGEGELSLSNSIAIFLAMLFLPIPAGPAKT